MWTDLLPLMTYCFVMSSTPGPNNVMLATSGALFGYRRALPQIFGTNSGVAVQTFITCLGLGSLFVAFPVLHQILRVTGALYLVFLAWKLSASALGEARETKPLSFAQAALFQAVNPKSWVKSITLASVFMPVGLSAPVGALLVAVVGLVIGFPTASMWALFGVAIRRLLNDPLKRRVFNLSMGAMLVALAVSFLL
jgi:threonine/homoserine/homoserine lactone efflux protein|nr:LysE family translocator [uncultured Rhodoferax sp.]